MADGKEFYKLLRRELAEIADTVLDQEQELLCAGETEDANAQIEELVERVRECMRRC